MENVGQQKLVYESADADTSVLTVGYEPTYVYGAAVELVRSDIRADGSTDYSRVVLTVGEALVLVGQLSAAVNLALTGDGNFYAPEMTA